MDTKTYQRFWFGMVFLSSFVFGVVFLGALLLTKKIEESKLDTAFQTSLSDLLRIPANCDGRIAR
jgi:hypothetical protein